MARIFSTQWGCAFARGWNSWLLILLGMGIAAISGCLKAERNIAGFPDQEASLLQKAEAYVNSRPDSSLLLTDSLIRSIGDVSDSFRNSIYFLRAKAFFANGQRDSCLQILPVLKAECKADRDTLNWLRAENLTGLAFMEIGHTTRAIDHALIAYDLAVRLKTPTHQVKALINLADFHRGKNEYIKSQSFLQKALRIVRERDSLSLMCDITASISYNFKQQGMMDSALTYGRKAILIAEQLGQPLYRMNAYNNMGMLCKKRNWDSAVSWLKMALEIDPKKMQPRFNLIDVYADLANWSLASALLDTLLEECRASGSGQGITRCLVQKAAIKHGQGRTKQAIPLLNEAIQMSDSLGIDYISRIGRASLAEMLKNSGRTREALEITEAIKRDDDSVNQREQLEAMKLLQDYQAAERKQLKLMDEQSESKSQLRKNQKLTGLLAGLLAGSGLLFLFYRFYATRRRATLLRQLEKYRQEVERWERQAKPDKEEDRSLLERLISRMEQEKPWLNPNLKMEDLINGLNCNRNALFAELKTANIPGLTQLVNQYRVEEAMRLMESPGYEMIKTEAIGMESGFGSYSSFHRAFEQINGITPNSYRRQLTQKSDATH